MRYLWPALIQLLAFGVAFGEVMLVSFGMLALLCAALAIYSWYYIVTELPRGAAIGFGIADLILIPIAVKFGFSFLGRSPVSHGSSLGSGSGFEDRDQALARLIGITAQVEAQLRPSGKIRVGSDFYEAHTSGDFVERNAAVRITAVTGNGFLVEKI